MLFKLRTCAFKAEKCPRHRPWPGDIGLAVYAMRDTESLKEPGRRRYRQSGVSPRHEQRRRFSISEA